MTDTTNRSIQDASKREVATPPRNHCIVICTHAHCDLLCTNPGHPPSASADDIEAATVAETAELLATTNAQPDQLGLPLTPGMATVILGQKECAWICGGKTTCRQVCWAAGDGQGAFVMDGGALADDEAVEGLGDCEVVEKGDVGPLIVCVVPEVAGGELSAAGDMDFDGMRCMIFWIGLMPHIVCHKV